MLPPSVREMVLQPGVEADYGRGVRSAKALGAGKQPDLAPGGVATRPSRSFTRLISG